MNSPIIRLMYSSFTTRVVAIYSDRLIVGQRYFLRFRPSKDVWSAAGHARLREQLSTSREILFSAINSIREQRPRSLKSSSPLFRFRITHSPTGVTSFSLEAEQAGHVRAALLDVKPDSYFSRRIPIRGNLSLFILLGIVCSLGLLAVIVGASMMEPATLIPGAAGLVLGLGLLLAPAEPWKNLQRGDLELHSPRQVWSWRLRAPFRSKTLGTILKLLGVGYLFLMLSPIGDGLIDTDKVKNPFLLSTVVWAPPTLLIYLGYQLCQTRYESNRTRTNRPAVLFLRPFSDDRTTTLQPPGFLAAFTGVRSTWGRDQLAKGRLSPRSLLLAAHPIRLCRMLFNYDVATSEESIVRYFNRKCQVIAIGRPGETLATPGAERMYVPDEDWQRTVLDLLNRVQAVVVQPGRTEGVAWELSQIRERVNPGRLLFSLAAFWRDGQGYEEMSKVAREAMNVSLPPDLPYHDQPNFMCFDDNWQPTVLPLSYKNPLVWPFSGDGVSLQTTLAPYFRRLHGTPAGSIRSPRWGPSPIRGLFAIVAAVVGIMIGFIPFGMTVVATNLISKLGQGLSADQVDSADSKQSVASAIPEDTFIFIHVPGDHLTPPYSVQVAGNWKHTTPWHLSVDRGFHTADGKLMVGVGASRIQEDVTRLEDQLVDSFSQNLPYVPKIRNSTSFELGGLTWKEITLDVGQTTITQIRYRMHSSHRGTIALTSFLKKTTSDEDARIERLIDRFFNSFELGDSSFRDQ